MQPSAPYEVQLAEHLEAPTGDGAFLGPTDAALAAEALRFFSALKYPSDDRHVRAVKAKLIRRLRRVRQ